MADEATQAGNDQQDAPQTEEPAGEDQQNQAQPTVEYMGKQRTPEELVEELKNTNAYVTRLQQQGAQPATTEPEEPQPHTEEDDGSQVYQETGLTQEQVAVLKKVTGSDRVDALEKKLSEYEKREQERQKQESFNSWKSDMDSLAKDFKDSGIDPTTPAEQEKLLQYMDANNYPTHLAKVAFKEMHGARLASNKTEPAAKSDRSDAQQTSNDESYKAALKAAVAKARKEGRSNPSNDELAEIEARFKGDPTMHAIASR